MNLGILGVGLYVRKLDKFNLFVPIFVVGYQLVGHLLHFFMGLLDVQFGNLLSLYGLRRRRFLENALLVNKLPNLVS